MDSYEFLFCLNCLVFCGVFLILLRKNSWRNSFRRRIIKPLSWASAILLCLLFIENLDPNHGYNNPTACLLSVKMKNCAVISPKGDVLQIFIEPQTIWIWDKVFNEENRLISLEQKGLAFSTAFISPISSNPKVRHFKYSFNLNVSAGLPAKLQVLRFEKERGRTLEGELEYWATEFIEKNSKDISLFYNRLDNNQQKRFFEMAREFINPKIKDSGTQIATARFDLPS